MIRVILILMGNILIVLQRLVPHHALSRLAGRLANSEIPWLKDLLIRSFIKVYKIDMSEYVRTDCSDFRHFNDFFTRELKPETRKIEGSITCPADGTVSAVGRINSNQIFQAKGITYSLEKLLATGDIANYRDGSFITIYLAPSNYHRVHFPVAATLTKATYVPGRLFSVNQTTAENVSDLFADNERLVCLMESVAGPISVIMVGAMIVAGIKPVWRQTIYPSKQLDTELFDPPQQYESGSELGQFHLGSTAIIVAPGEIRWQVGEGDIVRFGETLA